MVPSATEIAPPALVSRITHWINAVAITLMIGSGWRIYNASPFFAFTFPSFLTLGGWLGGALAIHFAMMWVLAASTMIYLLHGLLTGGLRRRLLPIRPAEVLQDLRLALTFRLRHDNGRYNAVQRLMYVGVLCAIIGVVVSGLALWKPVQLHWLSLLLGGYESTRRVHFLCMAAIVLFLVVHLSLVVIVPRTLLVMLFGRSFRTESVS
ncbi:MAG: cytochrome b/b6 domain-containing protein [Proteobacteria bacterium]|nr:cytochrome b/b6 domain-containing protein [Pseudomonadota bacterium]